MPPHQLTTDERCHMAHLTALGWSTDRIAVAMGRHRGTIWRERTRNQDGTGGYHPDTAQKLASERRTRANERYKLDQSKLGSVVCVKLIHGCSPEQITGWLKLRHPDDPAMRVTPETVYRWVYRRHQMGERWTRCLRRRGTRRRARIVGQRLETRGKIPGRVGIEHRPKVVEGRSRFGDWESDTLEGAKGKGLLVTHVERKSRYTVLGILPDKQAATLARVTCKMLGQLPESLRCTMTADNGKEFAQFARMEKRLKVKVYFANPHSPWERGTNENTNGLLREYFPKGCDLSKITQAELAKVQRMLNNRPRKCLNYRSPIEVLNQLPGVALRN